MKFYCDNDRHLVCIPYTENNLHRMAETLKLKRCWFHKKKRGRSHYDIPVSRIKEIQSKCTIVHRNDIIRIMKDEYRE